MGGKLRVSWGFLAIWQVEHRSGWTGSVEHPRLRFPKWPSVPENPKLGIFADSVAGLVDSKLRCKRRAQGKPAPGQTNHYKETLHEEGSVRLRDQPGRIYRWTR